MAPHFSTLAWKIPWVEEPGRLQSMGLWRVGHDWETLLSLFTFMHWRRKWQPTPVFLPGESQGVAQSWTRLKRLSRSSSSSSSHQVAKTLEFQFQHQSFQWILRTDLLQNGLVGIRKTYLVPCHSIRKTEGFVQLWASVSVPSDCVVLLQTYLDKLCVASSPSESQFSELLDGKDSLWCRLGWYPLCRSYFPIRVETKVKY